MNVLIISNNCISKSGAAGRTIANLFDNSKKNKLAQFYICDEIPDFDLCCQNFFRITDKEMLKSIFTRKNVGQIMINNDSEQSSIALINPKKTRYIKKTVFAFLARNFVWKFGRWKTPKFMNWLDEFSPDVVFICNTDCAFLINITLFIAKKKNIPIVIYNSESYYFYKKCYLYESGMSKILYPILHSSYRRAFKKLISYANTTIYNNPELKDVYYDEFKSLGTYIYMSSDILPQKKYNISKPPTFVYMGNLGLNRYKSLIEMGNTLFKINRNIRLDVYGNADTTEIIETLNDTPSIKYKGVISYEEVVKNMHAYDFIVHVESFEPRFIEDVKFGFSTKIADSLACGTCLIAYADNSISFVKHLLRENAACVISDPNDLQKELLSIINNQELRKKYVDNAVITAEKMHNRVHNIDHVNKILKKAIMDFNNK